MWVCGEMVTLIFLFARIRVYLIMDGKRASSNSKNRDQSGMTEKNPGENFDKELLKRRLEFAEGKVKTYTWEETKQAAMDRVVAKGVNTKKYCGTIKLDEDPLSIQQQMRKEWNNR